MNDEVSVGVPQLWGGVECSIVRLRQCWRDQSFETGHTGRLSDIDAIAGLGIRALRYPVLWEAVSPEAPDLADFTWHDIRLARLHELGIEVIAGLLHHGSGPHYTSLIDPDFPALLARHALTVARRYPWLKWFTPVNEPLTTARFSALYGHWYPHRSTLADFARAFVNQCRGVALSMRAIRTVIPHAQLMQTEDLSKIFSTPRLAYQAQYENERRWLTFDLLLGRIDRHHPWFQKLLDYGIEERELMEFVDSPCPPDLIGVNHYPTSERFLEHRPSKLVAGVPASGNARHRYADLEAVRVELPSGLTGPEARLREVCDRYDCPVAVTEVHHGCSRDEQLRWFVEVWDAARTLAAEGKRVRAVTAWALFGCVDWNTLLTSRNGSYEPGAFDIRSPTPRLTAIGRTIRTLANGGELNHAVLDNPGWWRRNIRFYRPPPVARATVRKQKPARRILIAAPRGELQQTLERICAHRGLDHVHVEGDELGSGDPILVDQVLDSHRPWAVVSAAGENGHSWRAKKAGRPRDVQLGAAALSAACAARDLKLLTFSVDPAFDGRQPRAFVEDDPPTQESSNAEAEARVLADHPQALVVRTTALYGPWGMRGMVFDWLRALSNEQPIRLPADTWCSPTYTPDLAHAALDLLIDGETGIWHLTNVGQTTWYEFGTQIAEGAGLNRGLVLNGAESPCPSAALSSVRGRIMPTLASGLERFLRDAGMPAMPR